jgi:hypothetical protein
MKRVRSLAISVPTIQSETFSASLQFLKKLYDNLLPLVDYVSGSDQSILLVELRDGARTSLVLDSPKEQFGYGWRDSHPGHNHRGWWVVSFYLLDPNGSGTAESISLYCLDFLGDLTRLGKAFEKVVNHVKCSNTDSLEVTFEVQAPDCVLTR